MNLQFNRLESLQKFYLTAIDSSYESLSLELKLLKKKFEGVFS
jgi:hypothetical protein